MTLKVSDVFKATITILLTLLGAYVIFASAEIILTLFMAIIVASAVRPAVRFFTKLRIPETIAIIFVYLILALATVLVLFVILPPLFNQFAIYIEQDWRLASRIIQAQQIVERYFSDVMKDNVSLVAPEQITEAVSTAVDQFNLLLPRLIQNTGNIVLGAVLIFVMGVYWLTSHLNAKRFILKMTSPRYRDRTRNIITEIETTLGSYVRGVVLISVSVGFLNFVPMYALGVPNALTLAFIIGLLTSVPMIGGWIGGLIATLLTLTVDPTFAIIVLIIFIIVSQIENYILQPRIMSGEVGIDPLLVIIYTSVGFLLNGILGALIAVPTMGALHILVNHLVVEPYRQQIIEESVDDDDEEEIIVELDEEDVVVELDEGDQVTIKRSDEDE